MSGTLLTAGAVVFSIAVSAAQQGRDATVSRVVGTAGVTGTVVSDDQNKTPLRRATVTIVGGDPEVARSTATDDQGRFSFGGLPAGRYNLSASKAAWLRTFYGSKHLGRAPFGTPPLELTSGATTTVVLSVPHGSAISGTIVDQSGRPVDAIVRLMTYKIANGVKTLSPATEDNGSGETDDRGNYRLFGIPPGHYIVQATSDEFFGDGAIHAATKDDAQTAPSGKSGLFADQGVSSNFSPMYFPGTADVSAATVVTLAENEDKTSIDFALQLVPSVRLSGKVTTPTGAPPQRLTIRLVPRDTPEEADGGLAMSSMSTAAWTTPEGEFAIPSVAPGHYTLIARASEGAADAAGPGRAGGRGGQAPMTGVVIFSGANTAVPLSLWAMEEITVDGHEISPLDLRLQPSLHLKGRVVFDGAAAPLATPITVSAQGGFGGSPSSQITMTSTVNVVGAFDISGIMPGRYRIVVQIAGKTNSGWIPASAIMAGHDALDAPVEIGPNDDLSNVTVRLTDRTGEISGSLIDGAGKPATSCFIIVFSTDRSLWGFAGRRIKMPVQPDDTGRFRVTDLPAGEYYIAATTDVDPSDMQDAAALETLAASAAKLTLADGEKKVQDFKIG